MGIFHLQRYTFAVFDSKEKASQGRVRVKKNPNKSKWPFLDNWNSDHMSVNVSVCMCVCVCVCMCVCESHMSMESAFISWAKVEEVCFYDSNDVLARVMKITHKHCKWLFITVKYKWVTMSYEKVCWIDLISHEYTW